jgi:hypothetical protein
MTKVEMRELVKSWVKVFAAGTMACYMAGVRDQWMLLDAGVAALLPVVYTWLDPSDKRFGTKK